MIDTDIMIIVLLVLQVVLLFVHALSQRREIRGLQRRISTLGTEVGLLKARARKPEPAVPEPEMLFAAYSRIAPEIPAGAVDLGPNNYRQNPAKGQFLSPSWI